MPSGLFPVAFPANTFSTFFTIPAFVIVALLMVSTIRYSKPQVAIRGKFTRGRILIILIGFGVLFFFLGLRKAPFVMYGLLVFYVSSGIISLIIQFIQDFFPDAEEK